MLNQSKKYKGIMFTTIKIKNRIIFIIALNLKIPKHINID